MKDQSIGRISDYKKKEMLTRTFVMGHVSKNKINVKLSLLSQLPPRLVLIFYSFLHFLQCSPKIQQTEREEEVRVCIHFVWRMWSGHQN